jgi:hypothetical protein
MLSVQEASLLLLLNTWAHDRRAGAMLYCPACADGRLGVLVSRPGYLAGHVAHVEADAAPEQVYRDLDATLRDVDRRERALYLGTLRHRYRWRGLRCWLGRHDWLRVPVLLNGRDCLAERCDRCRTMRLVSAPQPLCRRHAALILNAQEFASEPHP